MTEEKKYNFKINKNYIKDGLPHKKNGEKKNTQSPLNDNSMPKSFEKIRKIKLKDIIVKEYCLEHNL